MGRKLAPLRWSELVRRLKRFGFGGPHSGGRHPYMIRDDLVLTIPNPHHGDIGVELLKRILKQASISRADWMAMK
ncbi:MAG: type II toxin-antitoxin system HicA family toxin [Phycisphaerales bacterium]|nr:type II toxin-antitoxin system HicA family toxin [Phycisphaerales bacterium]